MTTRADWFIQAIETVGVDAEDPFAMPIEEAGQRIDLRDPKGTLELRLTELLAREARLDNRQVTCPIKNEGESTCHACPVSQAHDREQALGILCRIGREQEVVLTELAVLKCRAR